MTPLLRVLRLIWAAAPGAMLRGTLLSVLTLLAGVSLLGLSGWFITATGVAGLAGVGIAFDVFRPSAGVRFLALGRAAARYGERLATHDATLRALAALRVTLLRDRLRLSFEAAQRLRPGPTLTRLSADVDALDGVALRLILPTIAAVVTHLAGVALLCWLVHPLIALSLLGIEGLLAALVLWRAARRTFLPSLREERAAQALLRGSMAALRGQGDLVVSGRLTERRQQLGRMAARRDRARAQLDRNDHRTDAALGILTTLAAAAALALGGWLVSTGRIGAPAAAIGVFAALALHEAGAALRPGLTSLGRMQDAARRVLGPDAPAAALPPGPPRPVPALPGPAGLQATGLLYRRPGAVAPLFADLSLSVAPGETVALSAPSGRGKSTLLHVLAGVIPPEAGRVAIAGRDLADMDESELRAALTLMPQRSALIGGTVRDNLRLADDTITDAMAKAALVTVCLADRLQPRGGLDARLGEGGDGLSGGEARRLVLARALLRRPAVLLLDEPTEGLDQPTANAVLSRLRRDFPDTAILCAAHSPVETAWADRRIYL